MSASIKHRKLKGIIEAIVKVRGSMRDLFKLPFALKTLHNFRLWKERHRWLNRLLFAAIHLEFATVLATAIKVYMAMLDDTFWKWEAAGLLKYLYHSLGLLTGSESSNLMLAVVILLPQHYNVIDYTLYPFLRLYRNELADLVTVGQPGYRHISLCFNRHMTGSEKADFGNAYHRKFVQFYCLAMRLSFVVLIGLCSIFFYYLAFLLPVNTRLDILSLCTLLWAYHSDLSLVVFGIGFTMFLECFTAMIVYGAVLSWRRFCRTIRRVDICFVTNTGRDYDVRFVALYFRLRHGQRAYMNCLRVFQKVNHCILDMVFYVSASLYLTSQVELVIELFANRMGTALQSIIVTLLIVELMIIFLPMLILMMTSKQLYAVNGLLIGNYVRLARHRFRKPLSGFKTRALIKWSLFGEIVHSRKAFAFGLSFGIGRINSMTIFKLIPIYSSFMFMLIPIVIQKS